MSLEPGSAIGRIVREAEGYYELQLFEEALDRAERLLPHPKAGRFARSMRAECLRSLERYEEGTSAFMDLTSEEPGNVAAWVGLGWCLKRSGRLDQARQAMEGMLEANPGDAIGLFNLACYLALESDHVHALDFLGRAIRADEEYRALARTEEDFESLRGDPDFERIVAGD